MSLSLRSVARRSKSLRYICKTHGFEAHVCLSMRLSISERNARAHVHEGEGEFYWPLFSVLSILLTVHRFLARRGEALEGCSHRWMSPYVCISSSPRLNLITSITCAHPTALAFRTIQTAVLIETLTALGAEVTWSSCVR